MTATASDIHHVAIYRAELALHDARSSGIDAWIRAASDRLHEVLELDAQARSRRPSQSDRSTPTRLIIRLARFVQRSLCSCRR